MTAFIRQKTENEIASQAKDAFKKLGKSVCILSCFSDELPHASVATAVCNISNDPPSLLISMEKNASLALLLKESTTFAVNVLGSDQQDILDHCMSSSGQDRFKSGNWNPADEQLPILMGSQAIFCCRVAEIHSFETHHIIIARIEDSHCAEETSGLIYLGGKFHPIN